MSEKASSNNVRKPLSSWAGCADAELTDESFCYKTKVTEEDFERSAYISLAQNPMTPRDIFFSQFQRPQKEIHEYWVIEQVILAEWSAHIGYNRTETYTQTNSSGADETYTQTVTDWYSSAGTGKFNLRYTLNITGCDYGDLSEAQFLTQDRFAPVALKESKVEGFTVDMQRAPDTREAEIIQKKNRDGIFSQWLQTAPGDEHRFNINHAKFLSFKIARYFVPAYDMRYTYKDKTYYINSNSVELAFGQDCPKETESKLHAKKHTRKYIISALISTVLFPIFAVLFIVFFDNASLLRILYGALSAAMLVFACVLWPVFAVNYKKRRTEFLELAENEKSIKLNSFLFSRSLPQYHPRETLCFTVLDIPAVKIKKKR